MQENLLLTKLYIPPPSPRDVSRSHLYVRLDESLARGCKLTLLSAPVGYGKTTLVSNWISPLTTPVAWLSLDPEDDDPLRFWTYVIAALQTIQPDLGQTALTLLQNAQMASIETILSDLINQLTTLSNKIILVLDDYHHLVSSSLHQGILFFLDHLPPQFHLIIITREDPPLPLSQMRVKGQMIELRIKDLRFTLEECTQFLNKRMSLNLRPEEITLLGQRTEGWVAGLQMAALSLHDLEDPAAFIEAFAGDNRYVADYLIAEVLSRQPDPIREFLLQTAIVDRFTPELCEALTGSTYPQSNRIISTIEAQGLFVTPLDHVRQWYRYHQLFADLLRYRLLQNDPEKFFELNRIASRWFQQQGLFEEAVKYAQVAKDYDLVAELIEKYGLDMIGRGQLAQLQHWINDLPNATLLEHPYLSVFLVWVGSLTGQTNLAKKHLALAEANLPVAKSELYSEIACQIALLHGYAMRSLGDLDTSINHIKTALEYLPDDNVFLNCTIHLNLGGNYWLKGDFSAAEDPLKHAMAFINYAEVEYPALAAAGFLANTYLQQGKLNHVQALYQQIVEQNKHSTHPAAAYVFLEQGELFYERNDLESAKEVLTKTIQIGEHADKIVNVIRARLLLARLYQVLGTQEEVANLMLQADDLFKQASPRYQIMHQIEYEHYRISCLLSQQNLQAAIQWADQYENNRQSSTNPWVTLNDLDYAQVILADGRADQALAVLKSCEDTARISGTGRWLIQSLALQTLCYQAMDDIETALDTLGTALSMAVLQGYIRTFVDLGAPMKRLMEQAARAGIYPEYADKLLSSFPASSASAALIDPLTNQELQILQLMSAGLSHQEIADEIFLSINTVKWYSTHIYSKLGVHRREHAVSRARELGLV